MPRILSPKGVGKPDYSDDIFVQPVPEVRGPIKSFKFVGGPVTIPPGGSHTFRVNVPEEETVFTPNVYTTADRYVLLEVEIIEYVNGTPQLLGRYYGYQNVEIEIKYGHPLATHDIVVYNKGKESINVLVNEYGVKAKKKEVAYVKIIK